MKDKAVKTMRVKCPTCHSAFYIPDARIPVDKGIVFPCPSCKEGLIRARKPNPIKVKPVKKKIKKLSTGMELKKKILIKMSALPAMPQIILKARSIIGDPNSGLNELANLIETDQSIASRALILANSAYYGLPGKVSSIRHACVMLGFHRLGELINIAATSNLMGRALTGYGAESGVLWRHALSVAIGATIIAEDKYPELVNDAQVSGLLHDAGKIMLDSYIKERKKEFKEFMSDGLKTFLEAEKVILGFDHSDIASDICKIWGLPPAISIAIKYHHRPEASHDNTLAYIIHMADAISMMSDMGIGVDDVLYEMDRKSMEFLEMEDEDISKIMVEVVKQVNKITEDYMEN